MEVRIKRIDKTLPLPQYETEGAVAFDLLSRKEVTVQPGAIELIPANVIVEVPDGYALVIAARSSMPRKHGLTEPHGIGVIDQDYCGDEDEVKIQVFNFTKEAVTVPKGTKLAQGLLVRVDRATFKEVDQIRKKSRGGFGSTDQTSRLTYQKPSQMRTESAKATAAPNA
ncbi:MAG: dUTP diphosphatase [Candidatus Peregrinibacteria bacterium]